MTMKTMIALAALVAASAFAASPEAKAPAVEIVSAEFGLFDESTPQTLVFEPGNVVPHKTGQRYGWVIEVRTDKRTLSVSEEYLIEAARRPGKGTDLLSESLEIPARRRNQVSQRQLAPVDGRIYGEWSVGPNEPAGSRHLQVLIEGRPAADFRYEVK